MSEVGFSHATVEETGKNFKKWTARKNKYCECVEMVDIGVYNSCKHFCKYCYANCDEDKVKENYDIDLKIEQEFVNWE